MERSSNLMLFFLIFASGLVAVIQGSSRPTKLFVFGDSHADTGNLPKNFKTWRLPYGTTFGRPTGRFSDGRCFTDYLAKFMSIRSPIPHSRMEFSRKKVLSGMNFAVGGSGVFVDDSGGIVPNISTQLDHFQHLMNNSVYTRRDLMNSLVYVSLAGNDYGYYLERNGTLQGIPTFTVSLVKEIIVNLERIREMGATKIALSGLPPLGCLPLSTISNSYTQCDATQNLLVNNHNRILTDAVAKFNNQMKTSTIVILDLYNSFTTLLNHTTHSKGVAKFENPLTPCCKGTSNRYSCGDLDSNGTRLYTLCSDPKSAFFFDEAHPSQAGWREAFIIIKSTLQQFLF